MTEDGDVRDVQGSKVLMDQCEGKQYDSVG